MQRSINRAVLAAALLLSMVVAVGAPTNAAHADERRSTRIAGADRYATAVAVSRSSWPAGSDVVFLTAAGEFADALSVGAVAADRGPVLLADRDRLPTATAEELRRLQPGAVVVVGGQRAISDAVMEAAARYARATVRVAGPDRYATSVEVARFFAESPSTVYVANGGSYQTAIVGSTAAGAVDAPLVLVTATGLPPVVERYLADVQPERVVVVGNTAAVSDATASRIDTYAGEVVRIAGADHAATAAAAAADRHRRATRVLVATQASFPDALTGGAYAARLDAPLLLVDTDRVPLATACALGRLGATDIEVLGGAKAVSDRVVAQLRDGSSVTDPAACDRLFVPMTGAPLHDAVYSPSGDRLYVVNHQENHVEEIDVASGTHVRSLRVGSDPVDIDVTADGRYLYVTNLGSHDVMVVDLQTGSWVGPRIRLPRAVADDGDFRRAFTVAIDAGRRVMFTDTEFRSESGGAVWFLSHDDWLAAHRRWAAAPDDEAYVEPTHVAEAFEPPDGATASRMVRSADRSVVGLIVTSFPSQTDTSECDSLPTEEEVGGDPDVRTREDCRAEKEKESQDGGAATLVLWDAAAQRFGTYARSWGEPVTNLAFDADGDWVVVHGEGETTFVLKVADLWGSGLALRGTVTSAPGAEGMAVGRDGHGCLIAWRLVDGTGEAGLAQIEVLQLHAFDANVGRCRDRYLPARDAAGNPLVITLDDEMTTDGPRLNEIDLTRAQLVHGPAGRSLGAMTANGVQLLTPPRP